MHMCNSTFRRQFLHSSRICRVVACVRCVQPRKRVKPSSRAWYFAQSPTRPPISLLHVLPLTKIPPIMAAGSAPYHLLLPTVGKNDKEKIQQNGSRTTRALSLSLGYLFTVYQFIHFIHMHPSHTRQDKNTYYSYTSFTCFCNARASDPLNGATIPRTCACGEAPCVSVRVPRLSQKRDRPSSPLRQHRSSSWQPR